MTKSITRKIKKTLENNINEKDKIVFTISIESNHVNNQLDHILLNMENQINLPNYKIKNDQEKTDQVKSVKKGNKKGFIDGSYV